MFSLNFMQQRNYRNEQIFVLLVTNLSFFGSFLVFLE